MVKNVTALMLTLLVSASVIAAPQQPTIPAPAEPSRAYEYARVLATPFARAWNSDTRKMVADKAGKAFDASKTFVCSNASTAWTATKGAAQTSANYVAAHKVGFGVGFGVAAVVVPAALLAWKYRAQIGAGLGAARGAVVARMPAMPALPAVHMPAMPALNVGAKATAVKAAVVGFAGRVGGWFHRAPAVVAAPAPVAVVAAQPAGAVQA